MASNANTCSSGANPGKAFPKKNKFKHINYIVVLKRRVQVQSVISKRCFH